MIAIGASRKFLYMLCLGAAIIAMPFSMTFCHAAIIVFILAWLTEGHWSLKWQVLKNSIVLQLLLLFFAALLGGMIITENKGAGWKLLETHIFFFLVPIVFATSNIRLGQPDQRILFIAFIVTCFLASLICLATALSDISKAEGNLGGDSLYRWVQLSYTALADGVQMNPIYLSLYLIVCILLLADVYLFKTSEALSGTSRFMVSFLLLYFSMFTIMLASRMTIFCLLLFWVATGIATLRQKTKRKHSLKILAFITLATAILLLNPVSRHKIVLEWFTSRLNIEANTTYQNSTEIRFSLLWLSWETLKSTNVLTGNGTGDVEDQLREAAGKKNIRNIHDNFHPHNQYIFILLAVGIPGLLVYLAFILIPLSYAWTAKDYIFLSFLILMLIGGFTEPLLERQKAVVLFSLFFSLFAFHKHNLQTLTFPKLKVSAGN